MTANPNWFTDDLKVNPGVGDLLADTGPLIAGTYRLQACVAANVAFAAVIEWRDAANATNIRRILIPVAASTEFCMDLDVITDTDNERVRIMVILITQAAGNRVQGTIINKA